MYCKGAATRFDVTLNIDRYNLETDSFHASLNKLKPQNRKFVNNGDNFCEPVIQVLVLCILPIIIIMKNTFRILKEGLLFIEQKISNSTLPFLFVILSQTKLCFSIY